MVIDDDVLDILKYFEIDPNVGFLLPNPSAKLPEEFEPWHQIADEIQELIEYNMLEDRLQQLPLISTDILKTNNELRLAHLLLTTLAAGHVWQDGSDKARLTVPANISLPLFDVCYRLGLKPIVCHASVCLANWKPIQEMSAFNAAMIDIIAFRFIKHPGNRWFFTLTAQIEAELAEAICAITSACLHGKIEESTMQHIYNGVTKATSTIECMEEHVPPDIFYNGFRHFLSGYTHNALLAEQGGVIFEGKEDLGPQPLSGGSAAQSSTFHAIDGFLGIKHAHDIETFLAHHREYMPPKHREFIAWVRENVAKIPNLRNVPGYHEALVAVKKFREVHISVVTKFIALPAQGNSKVGTGGSSFMHLLHNIANDCTL